MKSAGVTRRRTGSRRSDDRTAARRGDAPRGQHFTGDKKVRGVSPNLRLLAVVVALMMVGVVLWWSYTHFQEPTIFATILGAVGAASLLYLAIVVAPARLVRSRIGRSRNASWTTLDRLRTENDIRTSLLQAITSLALVVGLVFTFLQVTSTQRTAQRQLELQQQQQVSERFTIGVANLANSSPAIRLGGVVTLIQVTRDAGNSSYDIAVSDILEAHVKSTLHLARREKTLAIEDPGKLPDIDAAIAGLTERDPTSMISFGPSNMSELDLRGLVLHAEQVEFWTFIDSNLGDSRFLYANAHYADFTDANLSRSSMEKTDMRNARFLKADMHQASLNCVDMRDTDLSDTNLANTTLIGVDLRGAQLTRAHLNGAVADESTAWPEGFDAQAVGVRVAPEFSGLADCK